VVWHWRQERRGRTPVAYRCGDYLIVPTYSEAGKTIYAVSCAEPFGEGRQSLGSMGTLADAKGYAKRHYARSQSDAATFAKNRNTVEEIFDDRSDPADGHAPKMP
jgi:hypothetical protein